MGIETETYNSQDNTKTGRENAYPVMGIETGHAGSVRSVLLPGVRMPTPSWGLKHVHSLTIHWSGSLA